MTPEPPRTVTEWDIQAYVDGQLESGTERAAAVEAYLAANPREQARARAYHRQNEAIRTRYQDVLAQPVPERLRPETRRAARAGKRIPAPLRAAAVVAALSCAALIGWLVGQPGVGPLERFADRTTGLLAEHGGFAPDEEADTLRSLAALGGVPRFDAEELELVSTRQVDNGDMYEARYLGPGGRELRLFVAPDPQRHDNLLYRTQEDGSKVVYWMQGPLMYALTGDFNERDLDSFANTAIREFRNRLDADQFADSGGDTHLSSGTEQAITAPGGDPAIPTAGQLQTSQSRIEEPVNGAPQGALPDRLPDSNEPEAQ
jgi:anti-sigma factor RsiW